MSLGCEYLLVVLISAVHLQQCLDALPKIAFVGFEYPVHDLSIRGREYLLQRLFRRDRRPLMCAVNLVLQAREVQTWRRCPRDMRRLRPQVR